MTPKICEHENTPEHPDVIREVVYTDASALRSLRQCSICNNSVEAPPEPLPKDIGGAGKIGHFYDWHLMKWRPIASRETYESKQLANLEIDGPVKRKRRKKAE